MPNPLISQITLPNGNTYDIKDTWARQQIESITGGSAIVFKGVSTTALTDDGNEDPTVDGSAVTSKTIGDLYFYNKEEFIYGDDSKWHSLGPQLQTLGALAYKDNASATYTPAGTVSGGTFTGSNSTFTGTYIPSGTVSTPTISVNTAGSTASIKQVNAVTDMVSALATAVPGATAPTNAITYFSVANENLSLYQIGATKAAPITTTTTTVKIGDASYTASQPTFTGEEDTISTSGTPNGSVSNIGFTGTQATITVS